MKPRFSKQKPSPRSRLFSTDLENRSGEFYTLSEDGASITCCVCGFTSKDPSDVQNRYCPVCRVFHPDRMVMARLSEGYRTRFVWKSAGLRWKSVR